MIGVDIGGTKCAVVSGDENGRIHKKISFPTQDCATTCAKIVEAVRQLDPQDAIGISCGGPLDSRRGLILSPPNLPGWDEVPIVEMLQEEFSLPTFLKNDADACALAEWKFGAGRGTQNMVFLTFGTGLGAGLILGGRLYSGAADMAGEVGHIRLAEFGPVGYGKAGSFEGFCSGGGLAQQGKTAATERRQQGHPFPIPQEDITAKTLAEAAKAGDEAALSVYRQCGRMLGRGLSVLIDILNPEMIVIGSIFERAEELLREEMEKIIEKEALARSRAACRVVPAALGDAIGDVAAIGVAVCGLKGEL